jgi:alkanesulfonate monooxygenase SsuD/methylene tetrahydromethanopterin reductase-like flavin-dependent oxidoreductase (luciferase family)
MEQEITRTMLGELIVGSGDTVQRGFQRFLETTPVDEIMISSHVYDHAARLRSYEIAAQSIAR